MKTKAIKRAKVIRKLMRGVWDSLDSHLPYAYAKNMEAPNTNKFNQDCVKEYSKMLVLLSTLY